MSDVIDLDVFVSDAATGAPIADAVTLAYGPLVPPQFNSRYTQGDGGCNFFHGPPMPSDVPFSFTVIAAGYKPFTTTDQPIMFGTASKNVTVTLSPFKRPITQAPRVWSANMCGVRVAGLPAVPGGAADASLVVSWFYDRYGAADRASIRAAWKARGLTHVILSWPDSRAYGQSPAQFAATCRELIADGFYPCPFLTSKDHDAPNVAAILNDLAPVFTQLVGLVPLVCIGWELSLWLSPTQVQQLTDAIAPRFTPSGCRVYVHFQERYMSYPQPDHDNADYWRLQVGKLTGVLHQRMLSEDMAAYRDNLSDCLERMAGNDNMPIDSGFGHPFDLVACEITAQPQFDGDMDEATGNAWGLYAIGTPGREGPGGFVVAMGSGNGS